MRRRHLLAGIGALAALAACGGGSSAPRIALFGDSLTSSRGLAVTRAQRMHDALGVPVDDYSQPGMRALDAQGLVAKSIAGTRATIAAIIFGGADVIGQTTPEAFEVELRRRVAEAQALGCRIVLATVIRHPAYLPQVEAINARIWAVAADTGATVADIYSLPTGGFIDDVHPDQVYSDAGTALIVAAVRRFL